LFPGDRAAHSNWFGVLGELGYIGLILLVANVGFAFLSCWRVHRMSRRYKELRDLRIYANAIISGLVVFCVSGTFLASQTSELAWHLIALSTALLFIAKSEARAADAAQQPQAQVA
jgi:O-antigen ligase